MTAFAHTKSSPVKKRRSSSGRREAGQSIVEMAFVLPVLILLLVVVVDAGRAFDAYIVLSNAAREGARFGSLQLEPPPIQVKDLVVQDVLGSGTNVTHMEYFTRDNVTVVDTSTSDSVKVIVWYDFPLWFGGIVGMDTFHLQTEAVMPKYSRAGQGS